MAHSSDSPRSPEPQPSSPEPRGFSEHTRRTSSENAHEQGWGLNEDERRHLSAGQRQRGGTDYDYGAQDFGDAPADTRQASPQPSSQTKPARPEKQQPQSVSREADRKRPARRKTA